jgi:hypothetical protein
VSLRYLELKNKRVLGVPLTGYETDRMERRRKNCGRHLLERTRSMPGLALDYLGVSSCIGLLTSPAVMLGAGVLSGDR